MVSGSSLGGLYGFTEHFAGSLSRVDSDLIRLMVLESGL